MSLMASFCVSFSPRDVLNMIWDLFESVSEGFRTYSSIFIKSIKKAELLTKSNDARIMVTYLRFCLGIQKLEQSIF